MGHPAVGIGATAMKFTDMTWQVWWTKDPNTSYSHCAGGGEVIRIQIKSRLMPSLGVKILVFCLWKVVTSLVGKPHL